MMTNNKENVLFENRAVGFPAFNQGWTIKDKSWMWPWWQLFAVLSDTIELQCQWPRLCNSLNSNLTWVWQEICHSRWKLQNTLNVCWKLHKMWFLETAGAVDPLATFSSYLSQTHWILWSFSGWCSSVSYFTTLQTLLWFWRVAEATLFSATLKIVPAVAAQSRWGVRTTWYGVNMTCKHSAPVH